MYFRKALEKRKYSAAKSEVERKKWDPWYCHKTSWWWQECDTWVVNNFAKCLAVILPKTCHGSHWVMAKSPSALCVKRLHAGILGLSWLSSPGTRGARLVFLKQWDSGGYWTFCLQLCRTQLKLVITTSTNVDIRRLKSPNNRLMLPCRSSFCPSSGTRACFSMQRNRDYRVQLIGLLWTSRICSRLKLCLSPGLPAISSSWQTGCHTLVF